MKQNNLGFHSIRYRLLIGFVIITLLPAVGITAVSIYVEYQNVQKQAASRLESVAAFRQLEIETWVDELFTEMVTTIKEETSFTRAQIILDLNRRNEYYETYQKASRFRLSLAIRQSEAGLVQLMYINTLGEIVLSTAEELEGTLMENDNFLISAMEKRSVQFSSEQMLFDSQYLLLGFPIEDWEGETIGVMVAVADLSRLFEIANDRVSLESTGSMYLINGNNILKPNNEVNGSEYFITESIDFGDEPFLDMISAEDSTSAVYQNNYQNKVIGVFHHMDLLEAGLIVEQDFSEAFEAISTIIRLTTIIGLMTILIAVGLSLLLTRQISNPLIEMVKTTSRIADGDLSQKLTISRKDEIALLADAFNIMTARLRDLIYTLEERVRERTVDLQYRALQLETTTKVSRDITSIMNIDTLLSRVADLIHDMFGFYAVKVFLLDSEAQVLILKASSGPVIPKRHVLPLDGSTINSLAVKENRAIIINDVTLEPIYIVDENLPETKAELVIPLRMGEHVIGTLDIDSELTEGFSDDDMIVFQSLADQITIAIDNARNYEKSKKLAILEERTRLARELHDSVTQSLASLELQAKAVQNYIRKNVNKAEESAQDLRGAVHETLQDMRVLIYNLRPIKQVDMGLELSLRREIDQIPEMPAHVNFNFSNEEKLSEDVEKILFRITQEAVRNICKHACANQVDISLNVDRKTAKLVILDNGCGFEPEELENQNLSFGLIGMREQAELLGGTFHIRSVKGEGTEITVHIPTENWRD